MFVMSNLPLCPFAAERQSNRTSTATNGTADGYATVPRGDALQISTMRPLSSSSRVSWQQPQAQLQVQAPQQRPTATPAAAIPSSQRAGHGHSRQSSGPIAPVVPVEAAVSRIYDDNNPRRQWQGLVSIQRPAALRREGSEAPAAENPLQCRLSLPSAAIGPGAAAGAEREEAGAVVGSVRSLRSNQVRGAKGLDRFTTRYRNAYHDRNHSSTSIRSPFTTPQDTESRTPPNTQQRHQSDAYPYNPLSPATAPTLHSGSVISSLPSASDAEVFGGRHGHRDLPSSSTVPSQNDGGRREFVSSTSLTPGRCPAMMPADASSSTMIPTTTPSTVPSLAPAGRGEADPPAEPGSTGTPPAAITILISPHVVRLTTSLDTICHQRGPPASLISLCDGRGPSLHFDRGLGVGAAAEAAATWSTTTTPASRASSLGSVSMWGERHSNVLHSNQRGPLTVTQVSYRAPTALWQLPVLTVVGDGNFTQPTRYECPSLVSSASTLTRQQRFPPMGDRDGWIDGGSGGGSSITANVYLHPQNTLSERLLPSGTGKQISTEGAVRAPSRSSFGYDAFSWGKEKDVVGTPPRDLGRTPCAAHNNTFRKSMQQSNDDPFAASLLPVLARKQTASYAQMQPANHTADAQEKAAHVVLGGGSATSELTLPHHVSQAYALSRQIRSSTLSLGNEEKRSQSLSQTCSDSNHLSDNGVGGPPSAFAQMARYSFSSNREMSLMSQPPGCQQMLPLPPPGRTDAESTVGSPRNCFNHNDVVHPHSLSEEGQSVGADASSDLNHYRKDGRGGTEGEDRFASPHPATVTESSLTHMGCSDSTYHAERTPLPPPAKRLRLPVAQEGVVLLNHVQHAQPQGELYRLLCLHHREPMNRFPRAFRGPPLAVRLASGAEGGVLLEEPWNGSGWGSYNNAPSRAGSTGPEDTAVTSELLSLTLPHHNRGRHHHHSALNATPVASDASTVEVNATHPHELYTRLLRNSVCEVEVVHPNPTDSTKASPAQSSSLLSAPQHHHQAGGVCVRYLGPLLGAVVRGSDSISEVAPGGRGRVVPPLSCSTAKVVANGFYSDALRQSQAQQKELQQNKAVEEYGEASYYDARGEGGREG